MNITHRLGTFFRRYWYQTIIAIASIGFVLISTFFQNKDLNENGVMTTGEIVECKLVKMNTACFVKVKFRTANGEIRIVKNTLNNVNGVCVTGKIVRLVYSTTGDLVEVIDDDQ